MKRSLFILSVLLLSLTLLNCNPGGAGSDERAAVPVEVSTAELGEVRQTLVYNGDIKAEVEVKVFAKIPDRIEEFYADAGDRVKKGQRIAKVLSTTIEQGVLQAKAGMTAAKAQEANQKVEYDRAKRLHNENAMSQQQFDAIQTQYEAIAAQAQQAEAAFNTAQSQLQDATVEAPITGIIGKRYYEAGDMATPAVPVVTVVQMDRVKIVFEATEQDLGRLAIGQDAVVRVRSYPDDKFEGRVIKISPVLDPMTRLASIEVLIDNPDHRLKPGMYAEIEITTGIISETIVVPRYAVMEATSLVSENGRDRVVKNYFIYVVGDSSQAEQRQLKVDYVNHQNIAVRSGIIVGEKLVVSGQNNLRDGVPVFIAENEEN